MQEEICPDCGQWRLIVEATGFCLPCSRERYPRLCICGICNNAFESKDKQQRYICSVCTREQWLGKNADKLENYMRIGLTFPLAEQKVIYDNRPICQCCGNKIKGGNRERHFFCKTTKECRRSARRFVYNKYTKGMNAEDALKEVLRKLERSAA